MVAGLVRDYLTSDEDIHIGSHYIVSEDLRHIKEYWAIYVEDNKIGDLGDETLRDFIGKVVRAEATVNTATSNTGGLLNPGVIKCRDAKGKPLYLPVEILSRLDISSGKVSQRDAPSYRDVANQNNMSAAMGGGNVFANILGNLPQILPGGETGGDDEAEVVEGGANTIEYFFDIANVQLGMRCQITDDFDRIKNQWIQCEQDTKEVPNLKKILDEEVVVKGLEWINKESSNEMELNMIDDKDESWGVTIDFESWKVTRVHYNKQFYKYGAQIGYDVLRVNGTPVRDDPKKFKSMLMSGPACQIILGIVEKGEAFRDSYLARDMVLVQVEFIDSPGKEMKIPWRSLLNAEEDDEDHGDFDAETFDISKWKRKALSSAEEVLIGARYKVTQDPKMMESWWEKCDLDPFAEPHMFCRSKGICREVDAEDGTIKLEWNEEGDIVFEWFPLQVCTLMKRSKTPVKPKRQPRAGLNEAAHAAAAAGAIRHRNNALEDSGAFMDARTGEWYMENVHDLIMGRTLKICTDENRIRQCYLDTYSREIEKSQLQSIIGRECNVIGMDPKNNTCEVRILNADFDVWVPVRITQPKVNNVSLDLTDGIQKDYPVNRSSDQRRDPARMAAHEKAVVLKRKPDTKRENGIYTYQLSKNSDDGWGVTWDWETWRVKAVNKQKQFYRVGIRPGWRLLQMNEYTVNERYQGYIKNCIQEGMECELQFNIDKLKVGDEVKMYSVKNSQYEGLPGILLEEIMDQHKWRMHVYATKSVKRIPVANIVKRSREPAETEKKDPARSPVTTKRRAMDDMDLGDDMQPTYYSGTARYQGICVNQHYRIVDDIEMIIKALDEIMPSQEMMHRDDAQDLAMQIVRVLEIDPARNEVTVITNDSARHHIPIHLLEHIEKSRTTDDLGGSRLPNGRNKRQRDFIQNL